MKHDFTMNEGFVIATFTLSWFTWVSWVLPISYWMCFQLVSPFWFCICYLSNNSQNIPLDISTVQYIWKDRFSCLLLWIRLSQIKLSCRKARRNCRIQLNNQKWGMQRHWIALGSISCSPISVCYSFWKGKTRMECNRFTITKATWSLLYLLL